MENKRKIIIVATILIIVLSLLLCACDDNSNNGMSNQGNSKRNPLKTAYDTLYEEFGSNSCYTLGSDKSYLQVDTNPYDIDDYYNATNAQILKSAITALKLPDYIYQRMLKTTALRGRQEVTVNGINVSWTYHPDKGLEAIFTIA